MFHRGGATNAATMMSAKLPRPASAIRRVARALSGPMLSAPASRRVAGDCSDTSNVAICTPPAVGGRFTRPTLTAPGRFVDYLRGRFRSASAVATSAGNANSIDSSEVVTSAAVPKVAIVAKNDSSWPSGGQPHQRREELTDGCLGGGIVLVLRRGIALPLLQQ